MLIMVLPTAEKEIDRNFFTPRDYQVELLDKACKRNVIVQLGTGAGKTFIAVLLLKEYGLQLSAPLDKGGKRAFFIVAQVALVEQQADHISCHTTLQVGKMHGALNNDIWNSKQKFERFIEAHHVVVLTAQILLTLIDHAYFEISNAAVLIFDECHHALGVKHQYRVIMDRYMRIPEGSRPRILGLTASLINDKTPPNQLEAKLSKLEAVLNCSIETASNLVMISKFGAKPSELVIMCTDYKESNVHTKEVIHVLETYRNFCSNTEEFDPNFDVDPRKYIEEGINRTLSVLKQLGPWAAWKAATCFEKDFRKSANEKFLPDKTISFLQAAETCMLYIKKLLDPKMHSIRSLDSLTNYLPNKVSRLLDILLYYNPDTQAKQKCSEPLCGLIFVEQRYVCYYLNILLKQLGRWDSRFAYIKSDFICGNSSSGFSRDGSQELNKRQDEVLRRFRRGELNLLVSTSVLEEGVDVRQCNVVIKFDRPIEYRAYVQSKGRARKQGAKFFMLVEESDNSRCSEDLRDFQQIEKMLLRRYKTVHNPSDFQFTIAENVDDYYPAYTVPETGASVTLTTAITLINRYCGKLPSDIFTRLVAQNRLIPVDCGGITKYLAELILPINSPIKQAIRLEKPLDNKKLAQMAVALEACKQLHQKGELNDHLMPVGRESIAKLMCHLDEEPDEWTPDMGSAKVGSAKRKQLYDKRVSRALHEALLIPGQPCYIYVLEMELMKEPSIESNPKRRKFTNPEEYNNCFGFLSAKKLPTIPSFPAYLRQGDMRVSVVCAPNQVTLDEDTMEDIQFFHHYLFKNVLQLCKANLNFSMDIDTPIKTLIVPLNRDGIFNYSINMKYINEVVANKEELPRIPDPEVRKSYKFRAEDYRDTVVMPWYRNLEQPVFYYVAEILTNMSPSSAFPDTDYTTFNEYFIKKYNLEIYDQEQCLLDVDFTSSRLNLLLPRASGGKKRAGKTVDAATLQAQQQIFVPELMDKHPISSTLWNLISALPSLFYRINHLLLADELRERILTDALGVSKESVRPPEDFRWQPLSYPATYEEKQSLIVTKIQQLRERNKANQPAIAPPPATADFDIGVWDPELGAGLVADPILDAFAASASIEGQDDGMTHGGMASRDIRSGDLSDDEEETIMQLDFVKSLMQKAEMKQQLVSFINPREDMEVMGWDEDDDDTTAAALQDMPFVVLGLDRPDVPRTAIEINMNSLVADITNQILAPTAIEEQKSTDDEVNNLAITGSPGDPSEGAASSVVKSTPTDAVAAPTLQTLHTSEIDTYEDRDRPNTEEVINLNLFDDDEESQIAGASASLSDTTTYLSAEADDTALGSDEEFEELEKGEKEKSKKDREVAETGIVPEGEILAPTLSDSMFSFASPSPSSISLISEVTIEDLMKEREDNKYGVSPCLLLTALTTSNANDGINLERLETIGDSFLKYSVTDYLYHSHFDQHEGKLSFARSKEVSNCNLYRLGKRMGIPSLLVASKFDVHDSWLPPCYIPNNDFKAPNSEDAEEKDKFIEEVLDGKDDAERKEKEKTGWDQSESKENLCHTENGVETIMLPKPNVHHAAQEELSPLPHNMLTQQYISDKSIADAVEALIGAHLLTLGPKPTLKVMKWMGLKVLTEEVISEPPLLRFVDTPEQPDLSIRLLKDMYMQFRFSLLEEKIGYRFNDKAYLVQAFTHASYFKNRITGCYQRLEFLGDAVLDYMITRYLFEDGRQYSPGVLTDLRSALVNNTIFASLAVKFDFHKHFVAMCPGLHHMIEKFVILCRERNFFDANFNAEMYMVTTEEEIDEGQEEDIEVPKAMSDIFESVAGAVYLDSGRNLDVTWRVLYFLMKDTINECCANPPRSPIRELSELEPNKIRFSKLERIIESGKVRVTVDIGNKMKFTGMGRNYRIAKTTAAKRALRYLKSLEEQKIRDAEKRSRVIESIA